MRSVILMTIIVSHCFTFQKQLLFLECGAHSEFIIFPTRFFFYISSDGDVDREILNAKLLNIFLPFDSTTLNVCHNTRPAGLIQENTIEQKITELPVVRKWETITLTACTQKGTLCRNYRNMKNARLEWQKERN